jgi:hypothetical protein
MPVTGLGHDDEVINHSIIIGTPFSPDTIPTSFTKFMETFHDLDIVVFMRNILLCFSFGCVFLFFASGLFASTNTLLPILFLYAIEWP